MRYIGRPTMAIIGALLAMTAGCASIRSVDISKAPQHPIQGGIVYYLPTQRLVLTLTVSEEDPCKKESAGTKAGDAKDARGDAKGDEKTAVACDKPKKMVRKIDLAATPEFADLSKPYVAQYRRNHLGTNALTVRVNANGLLSGEGGGSTTPAVSEFFGALAGLGADTKRWTSGGDRETKGADDDLCGTPGTYVWTFGVEEAAALSADDRSDNITHCKIAINIFINGKDQRTKVESAATLEGALHTADWRNAGDNSDLNHGFFYRQKIPFEIEVVDTKKESSGKIYYIPLVTKHSPVEFLAIPSTLFANTTWKVGFENGSPTLYDINAGGDALGLVKLPAEILKGYSDALLSGLSRRKELSTAEVQNLQQLNALALQQAKAEACRAAVATGDLDKIKAACQ